MTQSKNLKTIRDFIRYAMSSFNAANLYYGHGTDNAWDEAIALVLRSLYLPLDVNPTILDARLTDDEKIKLLDLINQRITKKIPVPYLIHEAWFSGLLFYVDERVLIPRSPMAELIENQFAPWVSVNKVHRILDLCTGSGCIAIACAHSFKEATVDAVDISLDALSVAKINVLKHHVEHQVTLLESNLFKNIPNETYDIIISNPPYVSTEEMFDLPSEFQHEPALALAAGADGLDIVTQILRDSINYLSPNGILVVEVGNSEVALAEKYPEVPFTWLEFQCGGDGVFLLTCEQLHKYKNSFLA